MHDDWLFHIRSTVDHMSWPPVVNAMPATLTSLLRQMELSQWLPPEEIEQKQFVQLSTLVHYATQHSSAFRERLHQAGMTAQEVASSQGFKQLPVMTRRDIQRYGEALYCTEVPASHLPLTIVKTSGSTGEPVVAKRTAVTNLFWMAMTMRDNFWHQRDFTRRVSAIRANIPRLFEYPSWGAPVELLFPSGPSQYIPITTDLQEQLRLLDAFRPHDLFLYPSNLAAIMNECERVGKKMETIRRIRTIGETLSPALRQKAEHFFSTKVEDLYSSQEMGNMALQCPESGLYHVMAENILLEVLDHEGNACREGEVGRIVVTDLVNFATPLIRYDIGDYAEAGGTCPCGRGLPTINRFIGRERNLVIKPGGTRHWPLVGFDKFRSIAPINQYQLIQHDLEHIEARLVAERPLSTEEETILCKHINEALSGNYTLRFTYFQDRIPLQANGKFEEFICLAP